MNQFTKEKKFNHGKELGIDQKSIYDIIAYLYMGRKKSEEEFDLRKYILLNLIYNKDPGDYCNRIEALMTNKEILEKAIDEGIIIYSEHSFYQILAEAGNMEIFNQKCNPKENRICYYFIEENPDNYKKLLEKLTYNDS